MLSTAHQTFNAILVEDNGLYGINLYGKITGFTGKGVHAVNGGNICLAFKAIYSYNV